MQQHTPLPEDLTTLAIDLAKDTFQIAGENQQQRIVPEQHSSGDKTRLGRMNRRGAPHIRSLLIEGAHAVLRHIKSGHPEHDQQRLQRWQKRHGNKGAAIRLANHNLRIIWRLLTDDLDYQRNHRTPSTPPNQPPNRQAEKPTNQTPAEPPEVNQPNHP